MSDTDKNQSSKQQDNNSQHSLPQRFLENGLENDQGSIDGDKVADLHKVNNLTSITEKYEQEGS